MAIDLKKTQKLVTGGLLEQEPTWAGYAEGRHSAQDTLIWLTLPVVVAAAVISYLFRLVFHGYYVFGGVGFGSVVTGIIGGLLGIGICAGAGMFFANLFSDADSEAAQTQSVTGKATFDQAFGAVSFGILPAMVGSILGTLPWIGWLLSLAASIYALFCLYRVFPVFLHISESDRIKHYVATILTSIVGFAILVALLGSLFMGSAVRGQLGNLDRSGGDYPSRMAGSDAGMFGLGAGVNAIAEASEDRYEPPADGRLTSEQVKLFTRFMVRTQELRDEYGKNLEQLSEKAESKDRKPSISDLMSGVKGVMNVSGAEAQVVKSGGGNWAEYNWIKRTLIDARIQKDLNETIAHNYRLYQQYQDQLDPLL